jgi:hypothetical protein
MVGGQQSFKIFANTQIQWQKKRGKYCLWPRDVGRIADKLEGLHTSMLLNHLRDEEEQNQPGWNSRKDPLVANPKGDLPILTKLQSGHHSDDHLHPKNLSLCE